MISADGRELCLVVGHYKAGSTWLANLLNAHPQICGISETHIFRYASRIPDFRCCTDQIFRRGAWADGGLRRFPRRQVANWTRALRVKAKLARGQASLAIPDRPITRNDLGLLNQHRLQSLLIQATSTEDYCRRFFDFLHTWLRPEEYLMEKTPTNIFQVPLIRRIFPAAKLLAIYRDGRDVAVSDKFYMVRERSRETSVRESATKWRDAMQAQLDEETRSGVYCLSYESLLERPHDVVRGILRHLELPLDDDTVELMVYRSSFEFVTGRSRGSAANDFYRKGIAADWVNHFTPSDMQQFSEIAGEMLVALGYEESPDPKSWKQSPAVAGAVT